MTAEISPEAAAELLTTAAIINSHAAMRRAHPGRPSIDGTSCDEVRRRFMLWASEAYAECPHAPLASASALWTPSASLVMCYPCTKARMASQIGTPEDRTCDLCRELVGDGIAMTHGTLTIPARAAGPFIHAPVTIYFGTCQPCAAIPWPPYQPG